jgi:hypothetical protein
MVTLPAARESLLVRVDFSSNDAWEVAKAAATAENEDGFRAYLRAVDDRSNQGASWEDLARATPESPERPAVLFVVDTAALGVGHPILVVDLDEGRAPFRCIASELWGVDNNLNLSNMDWEEFAGQTDPDGVFRGFT